MPLRHELEGRIYTLAQFLLALGRYDPLTGAYRVTDPREPFEDSFQVLYMRKLDSSMP